MLRFPKKNYPLYGSLGEKKSFSTENMLMCDSKNRKGMNSKVKINICGKIKTALIKITPHLH